MTIILFLITILGIIFAPTIVSLIAPGFSRNSEQFRLAIFLTRVMFPFFIAIGIGAFFMGILYTQHIFSYPSFASCFLSIFELLFIFLVCPFTENKVLFLSISVVFGGFAQAYYQIIPIVKNKMKFNFLFDLKNEGLKRVGLLMLPATIGASFNQISAFCDMIFASSLREGSISALYYSNRLMLLPLALFGVAISTISLPVFSKTVTSENYIKLKEQICSHINLMSYFIIPSSIGLMVLAKPLIRLLFEHGKFDSNATNMASGALIFSSIGILAYALVKVLSTAYYSIKNTKTPVLVASFCIVLNIILNIILMKYLEVGGLALATSISAIMNAVLLIYFLERKIGNLGLRQYFFNFFKIVISGFFMAFVCFYFSKLFFDSRILSVILPILVGSIVYAFITYFMKVSEINLMINTVKSKYFLKTNKKG